MKRFRPAPRLAAAVLLASMPLTSCNFFDPFDGPTGDAQLLSAARACFDQGDLACAREMYNQISPNQANTVQSELAFTILDENGAGMGQFISFAEGTIGANLTKMAENIAKLGASTERRHAIYTAFQKRDSIVGNTDLKNFVQFTTALGLAAELLAEVAGADGELLASEILQNPASCDVATCAANVACGATSGLPLGSASDIGTTEPTGTVNSDHVYWAIQYAYSALQALGGSFGGTSGGMDAILNGPGSGQPNNNALIDRCFRAQLNSYGIGG